MPRASPVRCDGMEAFERRLLCPQRGDDGPDALARYLIQCWLMSDEIDHPQIRYVVPLTRLMGHPPARHRACDMTQTAALGRARWQVSVPGDQLDDVLSVSPAGDSATAASSGGGSGARRELMM
jgi:hypothetical protein